MQACQFLGESKSGQVTIAWWVYLSFLYKFRWTPDRKYLCVSGSWWLTVGVEVCGRWSHTKFIWFEIKVNMAISQFFLGGCLLSLQAGASRSLDGTHAKSSCARIFPLVPGVTSFRAVLAALKVNPRCIVFVVLSEQLMVRYRFVKRFWSIAMVYGHLRRSAPGRRKWLVGCIFVVT